MSLSNGVAVDKRKSDQARLEGNTAFKKGKWADSIGHYTNAILHNPSDPVAYCNRAQAYLRLDKYRDAERDCSSALERDANNIKALYRRGIARRGLERYTDALEDLRRVLKLDAGNEQATEEVREIEELSPSHTEPGTKTTALDTRPASNADSDQPSGQTTTRSPISSSVPISSLHANATPSDAQHSSASQPRSDAPRQTTSFAALKQNRDAKRSNIVPLTIPASPMRAALQSEPRRQLKPPTDPSSVAPGTGILLIRALAPLSPPDAWQLLSFYPAKNVPVVLGPILEPDSLAKVLLAVSQAGGDELHSVEAIMRGLKGTPRIKMNVAMLDDGAATAARELWQRIGGEGEWP